MSGGYLFDEREGLRADPNFTFALRPEGKRPDDLNERFEAFVRDNPAAVQMFIDFALRAARSGRKVGAKAVVERMRWETTVETTGLEFKLDNSLTSRLGRYFAQLHPEHADFFDFRSLASEDAA